MLVPYLTTQFRLAPQGTPDFKACIGEFRIFVPASMSAVVLVALFLYALPAQLEEKGPAQSNAISTFLSRGRSATLFFALGSRVLAVERLWRPLH